MASKLIRTPLVLNAAQCRGYAQACPAPKLGSAKSVSAVLPNKLFVATHDDNSPLTRICLSFRAGSRYEPKGELGLTHALRAMSGLTTKNINAFLLQRKLQQIGATISTTIDREIVTYTLEVCRNNLEEAIGYLNTIAVETEFRPWEMSDELHRLNYEIAGLPPQVRLVDLLHKAAFRVGLGNSLFISPRRIGRVSSESLQHYVSDNFVSNRCAVTGVGISQDRLVALAQNITVSEGKGDSAQATVFKSAELRKETGGPLAHIAVAVPGTTANAKDTLALAILGRAIGTGPVTKWGADNSLLGKAVKNMPAAISSFNVSYSDSGLFGFMLTVAAENAKEAVKSANGALKSLGSLDKGAIERGRNQLLTEVLSSPSGNIVEQMAVQGLYTGTLKSLNEIGEEIAKLSASDVSAAASSIASKKPAMAAVGNLGDVPYLDEL